MKKNFLFGLIGAGALILSGSVGFAAWTIKNSTDSKEDSSLKITADAEVKDERIKLGECSWTDSLVEFKPVRTTETYSWLEVSDSIAPENLGATYSIAGTAKAGQNLTISAKFEDATETTKDENAKKYADLVTLGDSEDGKTHGIVGTLPTPTISGGSSGNASVKADSTSGAFSATISVQFSWGGAFDGCNPYKYYNSKKYSESLADLAKTNIGYLSYLPKCSFKLTVTVTASN